MAADKKAEPQEPTQEPIRAGGYVLVDGVWVLPGDDED